jgi:hypothetical protein
MEASDIFWFRIWSLVASVLIAGIGSCTYGLQATKDKWEKAVANGADPMVVSCALGIGNTATSHGEAIICASIAQNRK